MSRGYEEDQMPDPRNIRKIFQKNLLQRRESYVDEIERATQQDPELRSERSSLSRAFSLFRSLVTKHSSSLQALQQIAIDDLQRYIISRSTMNRIMILIDRLDSSPSSSNNIKPPGSTAPPSSSMLPSHSSSSSSRAVGRHDTLLNVKENQQSSLSSNYMHPSFARNVSIQSEDNYYDDDFEEFNPDVDIAEEVSEDDDEEEKQKRFFAEVMTDTHEITYIAATDHRKSSFVDRLRESQHNSTTPTTSSSQTIIQPKKVNSSVSHEDLPPSSRNYYSSRSQDPHPTGSLDSVDQDHPVRVSTAMTSASTTGAFSRVSTADPNQQPKKRHKNPTWISKRQWRLGEKIGSGSFGEVFQAMNDKGKLFAAKRMNVIDKSLEVDNLLGEIQLMRGLSHKHIVEYLGAFVDTEACYLYIFQEWVPGGSVAHLLKKFGPFSPSVVKNYTRQVLLGLQYLHANGIIHRDIKGGNILVDDGGTVKLADFGASTKLSAFDKTQETTTIKGTPYFMAPEVLAASRYGRKGDIWAVGCTMIQMLTGEPPWKDRNLKGLIQLHLLLSSWNQGPPPYNCELSPDGRRCLEMCFRKDENERPSAVELLQCTFLRDDDLEDSHNGSFNNSFRSGNSAFPSQRDLLEDSGVLTGLKQEINKAVTRSMAGFPSHQPNAVEDTMQMIDRKIAEKQQQQHIPPPSSSNPFASRPNEAAPRSIESVQHLLDRLPSGNNYNSNDPGPTISGPKFSRDVPIPTPLSLQQVSNSANNSTGTTPYSNNPYKKGNIAIKNNQPQSSNPFGRDYIANNSSSSRSDEGENKATNPSNLMSPNNHLPVNPVTTPIPVRSNATTPSTAANTPVRDSLHAIKRRASEKALGVPGSNLVRRPGTSSNQSSNRDTEELTPLPVDDDVNPEDEINILPSGKALSSNPFASNSRDEAKRSFYDTRYYEEKQRDGNPFQKNTTPSALVAPSRSNTASPSFIPDDVKEDYSPFSLSSNNVSRKSDLEREVSVESIADEVGDNYYTRDMNSSNDDVPLRVNKNPFSTNTVEDIKVMSSLKTSQSIDSAGRRYYYPTKHLEENQSDVHNKPNIHQAIMKKSASSSDGVKTTSNRVSPVPRLTALENPNSDIVGNLAPGRALREQARRNSDKYSSSESARILRPEPVIDPITRPASSNASFAYQDKGSRNVSAAASPSTLRVEGTKQRGSLGSNTNFNTPAVNPTKLSSMSTAGATDSRVNWKCGRCNSLNVPNIDYCERCSTRRGVSGDRKADAVVPRF